MKNSPTLEADQIKREFFDPPTVTEICKSLISKYLPLSRDDLEMWDTDPEQYGNFISNSPKSITIHNKTVKALQISNLLQFNQISTELFLPKLGTCNVIRTIINRTRAVKLLTSLRFIASQLKWIVSALL